MHDLEPGGPSNYEDEDELPATKVHARLSIAGCEREHSTSQLYVRKLIYGGSLSKNLSLVGAIDEL